MVIPKQLQNPNFRFVLLGRWNKWRDPKTKEDKIVEPNEYKKVKEENKLKPLGKAPFQTAWQSKNNYIYNDPDLLSHIQKGFNFGVIGGAGNLIILDIDDKKLGDEFEKKLDTFTIKTGSGGKHFYFISNYDTNHVLVNDLGELRAKNYQVVSAPCRHPSGNYYEVVKDIPIQDISVNDLQELIKPYLRKEDSHKPSLFSTIADQIEGKDTSRSGLEFRRAIAEFRKGKSRKDVKKTLMAYKKFADSPEQYQERTLDNAESFALNEKEPPSDKEERLSYLLSKEKNPFKSMAIGEHNDHYYFGSILNSGNKKIPIVILDDGTIFWNYTEKTEDGTRVDNEIRDKFGLNYRFELFDDCIDNLWSNKSIKEFKEGKSEQRNFKKMFEEIKNKNKEFMFYQDERIHSFISCDIISNYFYPLFNCKGRVYFQADFGSGKSRQSRIYQKLSFNSLFASNISPASFERVIESTGGTIIVDNFDNISEELKPQILQTIEVYYKKGGKNIKADGVKHRPIAYNGFSPLVINNIVGLPEVTESRCNKIQLLKTTKKTIVDKKIDDKDIFWNKTKDNLHILALQKWKEVKDIYDALEVKELTARDLERVEAVLTIAKCVSNEIYGEILNYILETNEQQSIKELSDNWEFMIYDFLNDVLKDKFEVQIKVKEITESLKEKIIQSDKTAKTDKLKFSHYVGKILKGVPTFKKKVIDGWVHYQITRLDLNKMLEIKGFDRYLTIPHLTSLNNTYNTNNTENIIKIKNNDNNDNLHIKKSEVSEVSDVQVVKCNKILGSKNNNYSEDLTNEM